MDLKKHIRIFPDFPKPGINFLDITTLLANPSAFDYALMKMAAHVAACEVDHIVGIESRGFIFGAALANRLGISFIPVRKPGKLPGEVLRQSYALEYGEDCLEIHKDAILPGQKVAIVDDLIATGGTLKASCQLVEQLGGKVATLTALVALPFLSYQKILSEYDIFHLLSYESE